MDDLLSAFPEAIRAEAIKPVSLLLKQIEPIKYLVDRKVRPFFDVRLGNEIVSVPLRLYDDSKFMTLSHTPLLKEYVAPAVDLSERQVLIYFCLLTRHHNGFVREDALCRIASAQESFVVPFVAQLASEYVYEILFQIWQRLDQLSPAIYGPFFRNNTDWLIKLRQRMISYWDCYYRWDDYTGIDGRTHRSWRDPYIGFEVFDAFESMAAGQE